ncbi:MAG: NTP transferase domain-containing protein [Spirochaetes bacterium]|nr:NTP transferase domain-containing protein [Spirochaetota bacterium]
MKTIVILAARINSRRLPGKMLLPLNGTPLIEVAIRRLQKSRTIDGIVLATTKKTWPHVKDIVARTGIEYFLGSEKDVLGRFYHAAKRAKADLVVRATGDNPLVSAKGVDMIVRYHKRHHADLSHYLGLPLGCGVEVISFPALAAAHKEADDSFSREHITQYLYRNRDRFSVHEPVVAPSLRRGDLSLTVDTPGDYRRVKRIFRHFHRDGTTVGIEKIIRYARRHGASFLEKRYWKSIDNINILC